MWSKHLDTLEKWSRFLFWFLFRAIIKKFFCQQVKKTILEDSVGVFTNLLITLIFWLVLMVPFFSKT